MSNTWSAHDYAPKVTSRITRIFFLLKYTISDPRNGLNSSHKFFWHVFLPKHYCWLTLSELEYGITRCQKENRAVTSCPLPPLTVCTLSLSLSSSRDKDRDVCDSHLPFMSATAIHPSVFLLLLLQPKKLVTQDREREFHFPSLSRSCSTLC